MKIILTLLFVTIGLMVGSPSYAAQGDEKGKPFQELEQRLEQLIADQIELEARLREAGDALEATARAAADAELQGQIAQERLDRIEQDAVLQAQINVHADLLLDLDDRVSVLEGLHLSRSITWEETANFDVVDLAGAIAGLDYQPGEWIFLVSRNALTGTEFGTCTNNPKVTNWLAAVSSGSYYYSGYISDGNSFYYVNGNWSGSPSFYMYTYRSSYYGYQYLYIYTPGTSQATVFDPNGVLDPSRELQSIFFADYTSGYAIGNTTTINVAADSHSACGYAP